MIIFDLLYSIELFLEKWSQLATVVIAALTIVAPFLIYMHQKKEMDEKIRQGITSIIEEVEKECRGVKEISKICEEVEILDKKIKELSNEDDDFEKYVEITKRKLSEFKKISKKLHLTDKLRGTDSILVENRNRKFSIMNCRRKVKVKVLEEKLGLIYALIETNYQLREAIIQKIPEVEPILHGEKLVLKNIYNTFEKIENLLSELKINSDQIVERWRELKIIIC